MAIAQPLIFRSCIPSSRYAANRKDINVIRIFTIICLLITCTKYDTITAHCYNKMKIPIFHKCRKILFLFYISFLHVARYFARPVRYLQVSRNYLLVLCILTSKEYLAVSLVERIIPPSRTHSYMLSSQHLLYTTRNIIYNTLQNGRVYRRVTVVSLSPFHMSYVYAV